MNKRDNPCCGLARFLTLMDGPWSTLIIRELLKSPMRFTELRKSLTGISAHTLSHRLKQFETNGLVTRTAYAEPPPRVVYELTPLGEGLRDVLEAMRVWGDSIPDRRADANQLDKVEASPCQFSTENNQTRSSSYK